MKIEKYFYFFILILFTRVIVTEYPAMQWIVWNVGQGQWVTFINGHRCWHFDFGGEKNPIHEVSKYCLWRENRLILSHPDRDHYIFLNSIKERFKQVCLEGPSWKTLPLQKLGASKIKKCDTHNFMENAFFQTNQKQILYQTRHRNRPKVDKNLKSQIFHSKHWLITGDAPQVVEKDWITQTPEEEEQSVTRLLLGHHGSKTSTSLELLQKLTQLNQCIVSSREKKYGHPHKDVRIRVKSFCSLIRTEDWNHLHYLEGL